MVLSSPRLMAPIGLASFRNVLQRKRADVSRSPILVIASEAAAANLTSVEKAVQHVQFTMAQQLGFRTVQTTISSAYPTHDDLEQKIDLARRAGAMSAIVAVGSGAAIDLAKAVAFHASSRDKAELEPLVVLVPATYFAVLASYASHSLFIDSTEEAIVPVPAAPSSSHNRNNLVITPSESNLVARSAGDGDDSSHIIYAAISIALDSWYRNSSDNLDGNNPQEQHAISDFMTNIASEIETSSLSAGHNRMMGWISHEILLEFSSKAGKLLSYGLEGGIRSSPLALAASLQTRLFPHVSLVTFLASLVPGLCQLVLEKQAQGDGEQVSDNQFDPIVTSLMQRLADPSETPDAGQTQLPAPPRLVVGEDHSGYSVPDMSLSHILANRALWNCFDLPDAALTRILRDSLEAWG